MKKKVLVKIRLWFLNRILAALLGIAAEIVSWIGKTLKITISPMVILILAFSGEKLANKIFNLYFMSDFDFKEGNVVEFINDGVKKKGSIIKLNGVLKIREWYSSTGDYPIADIYPITKDTKLI